HCRSCFGCGSSWTAGKIGAGLSPFECPRVRITIGKRDACRCRNQPGKPLAHPAAGSGLSPEVSG
ncbi:MAG: hypothetical protein ACK57O_02445, partial [Planctomyces sp.]